VTRQPEMYANFACHKSPRGHWLQRLGIPPLILALKSETFSFSGECSMLAIQIHCSGVFGLLVFGTLLPDRDWDAYGRAQQRMKYPGETTKFSGH
jgi:hypothetical protein